MQRTLFVSLFAIVSLSIPMVSSAAVGVPFGGKVVSVPVPCINLPGAFQLLVLEKVVGAVPVTLSFVWAPPPLTATCLFSGKCTPAPVVGAVGVGAALPPHTGQTLLGLASVPTVCVVAGVPVPGLLIKLVGTSLL